MKSTLLILLTFAATTIVMGDDEEEKVAPKIKTEGIAVCDSSGRECVTITAAGIWIHGYGERADSMGSVAIGVDHGPGVTLRSHSKSGARLLMRLNPTDGSPSVALWDKEGDLRTILGSPKTETRRQNPAHRRGTGTLTFFNEHRVPFLVLP